MTRTAFLKSVGKMARDLHAMHLPEMGGAFSRALAELHHDAGDYQHKPWATPERAIEVIIEEVRVLVHAANEAKLEHPQVDALVTLCIEASAAGLIKDQQHMDFFAGCQPSKQTI